MAADLKASQRILMTSVMPKQKYRELGSADALIEAMGDDLNEELIVQIKAIKGGARW